MKYTKAIKNGKLKATDIQVGESVTGTLVGFRENKYGTQNVLIEVQGREVEIYSAGNLKFLKKDVDAGKKTLGSFTTITRSDDIDIRGYACSQFAVTQTDAENSVNTANTPVAAKPSVKAQLDEIRAKKNNGQNA